MFRKCYDPEALLTIFHRKFNHPVGNGDILDENLWDLRIKLIEEEFNELKNSVELLKQSKHKEEMVDNIDSILDAMGDLLYVIYGTSVAFDIPTYNIFETIHKHNMLKLGEDGKPIYNEYGKIQKGPKYFPPSFKDIAEKLLNKSKIFKEKFEKDGD